MTPKSTRRFTNTFWSSRAPGWFDRAASQCMNFQSRTHVQHRRRSVDRGVIAGRGAGRCRPERYVIWGCNGRLQIQSCRMVGAIDHECPTIAGELQVSRIFCLQYCTSISIISVPVRHFIQHYIILWRGLLTDTSYYTQHSRKDGVSPSTKPNLVLDTVYRNLRRERPPPWKLFS